MSDELYALTPAVFRERDLELGQPLRALLQVLQTTHDSVGAEIDQLYRNWFIETCELGDVPLVGSIVRAGEHLRLTELYPSLRSYVGNLVAYRKRRGRLPTLEQAARDATGHAVKVTVSRPVLSVTQALVDVRLTRGRTVDLRRTLDLDLLPTPFSPWARTVDVRAAFDQADGERCRRAPLRPGSATISVWRAGAQPIYGATPRQALDDTGRPRRGCFHFDPLGLDVPLFGTPATVGDLTTAVGPASVPWPIPRAWLRDAQLAVRAKDAAAPHLVGPDGNLAIYTGAPPTPVPADRVGAGDLSRWDVARAVAGQGRVDVVVDPELGRLAFIGAPPDHVLVDYAYGAGASIGASPAPRRTAPTPPGSTLILVGPFTGGATAQAAPHAGDPPGVTVLRVSDLGRALDAARAATSQRVVVRVVDSRTYMGSAGTEGALAFADLPIDDDKEVVIEAESGERPCVAGDLTFAGRGHGARLTLAGLLVDGHLVAQGAMALTLRRTSVLPTRPPSRRSTVSSPTGPLRLDIVECVVGAVRAARDDTTLTISDSIVDGSPLEVAPSVDAPVGEAALVTIGFALPSRAALAGITSAVSPVAHGGDALAPDVTLRRSTFLGAVVAAGLQASDVLFDAPAWVQQTFDGEARRCFLPDGSRVPPAPDAVFGDVGAAPVFLSRRPGRPGYARLAPAAPRSIREGGSDGLEIGAFHAQQEPLRERRLVEALHGFLPATLEPTILYET